MRTVYRRWHIPPDEHAQKEARQQGFDEKGWQARREAPRITNSPKTHTTKETPKQQTKENYTTEEKPKTLTQSVNATQDELNAAEERAKATMEELGRWKCEWCGTNNRPGALHCRKCGAQPAVWTCKQCGQEDNRGDKCEACGEPLDPSDTIVSGDAPKNLSKNTLRKDYFSTVAFLAVLFAVFVGATTFLVHDIIVLPLLILEPTHLVLLVLASFVDVVIGLALVQTIRDYKKDVTEKAEIARNMANAPARRE